MVSGMLVLAHRGANRLAPENTVPAMREAVDRGADGVELDVHRTTDDVLVVRHDAETPIGLLGEVTAVDLARALPDVPTLAAVLDVCRGRLVNIEIKDPDPRAAEQEKARQSLSDWLEQAGRWFEAQLRRPGAEAARAYLHKRGLPEDQWARFRIGYAPGGRTGLKDFLVAKGALPKELFEAARIDGAGRWVSFRYITWPLIWPVTALVLTIQLILQLKVFDQVYLMIANGRVDATMVLVQYIYTVAFQRNQGGYASTVAVALFVIVLVVAVLQFQILRFRSAK